MSSDALTFESLVTAICQADSALAAQASKAVNVSLTLRNWFIGFYIAEFELQGADRAIYGENLLIELAKALRAAQVSNTGRRQLYGYLAFYRAYPQIMRTLSAQSANALSVDPDRLINRLSYSHLEQIVELTDPLKRSFYEIEAMRGNWSVRELKRQIGTQYFERSGLSNDKDALSKLAHAQAETHNTQHIIRDPYVFEFLGLKPREVMSESHLEDTLIDKLQEFLLELGSVNHHSIAATETRMAQDATHRAQCT